MCGRYSLARIDPAALRLRFGIDESVPVTPRFNIAPGNDVLARAGGPGASPHGELLRWGFLPPWARSVNAGLKLINARAETLADRRAYRDAFRRRRCLICADGFYEWQAREHAAKQPFHLRRRDGQPFAFAGLWSSWCQDDATPLRTCTIVTRAATGELAAIHDRMPVILPAAAECRWLDADATPGELAELLAGVPPTELAARPVSTAVNGADHDSPDCLADPPQPAQLSLLV